MKSFLTYLEERKQFQSTLQYHEQLNPLLWDRGRLNSEVRSHLLAIAAAWQKTANIPDELVEDIIMTGGNCNYNYTSDSDIDVHLVVNLSKMPITDPELLQDYIRDKKDLWADKHKHITVKGYPVELYAQDISVHYNNDHGVYSLRDNKWLVEPQYFTDIDYSNPEFVKKVESFIKRINAAIKNHVSIDAAKELKNEITSVRAAAILTGGEFAQDNLVFKELRNRGYLQKITNYIDHLNDTQLSLKN